MSHCCQSAPAILRDETELALGSKRVAFIAKNTHTNKLTTKKFTNKKIIKTSETNLLYKKKTFKQINMEGGQSGTYLRLVRASSGPWASVAKT